SFLAFLAGPFVAAPWCKRTKSTLTGQPQNIPLAEWETLVGFGFRLVFQVQALLRRRSCVHDMWAVSRSSAIEWARVGRNEVRLTQASVLKSLICGRSRGLPMGLSTFPTARPVPIVSR